MAISVLSLITAGPPLTAVSCPSPRPQATAQIPVRTVANSLPCSLPQTTQRASPSVTMVPFLQATALPQPVSPPQTTQPALSTTISPPQTTQPALSTTISPSQTTKQTLLKTPMQTLPPSNTDPSVTPSTFLYLGQGFYI